MPSPTKGIDIHSHTPLPATLLHKLEIYHLQQEQSLTLSEHPHIHYPPPAAYWQQHPTHRQDLVRYLAKYKAHAMQAGLQITYWRTSSDGKGRFYAQGPAAQRLPKELRILLFGRTRVEIDITGAFYEIIHRTTSNLQETPEYRHLPVLLPIEQARQHAEQELLRHHHNPMLHQLPNGSSTLPSTPRSLPLRILLLTYNTPTHLPSQSKQPTSHRQRYTSS